MSVGSSATLRSRSDAVGSIRVTCSRTARVWLQAPQNDDEINSNSIEGRVTVASTEAGDDAVAL